MSLILLTETEVLTFKNKIMEFKNIIGIDMAKENFELVLLVDGKKTIQLQVKNHLKKIQTLFKENKIDLDYTLICL